MEIIISLGIIVVLIAVFIICIYNSVVSASVKVKNAWAQIDTQLKRRYDLLPNLIETVKSYANYESATLEKIVEARNIYEKAETVAAKAEASNIISNSLDSFFALAEAYPDLKASENYLNLQTELSDTESKISYARESYNDAVQLYNEKIGVFPNSIIAKKFNFVEKEFFKVDDKEKENIKVKL